MLEPPDKLVDKALTGRKPVAIRLTTTDDQKVYIHDDLATKHRKLFAFIRYYAERLRSVAVQPKIFINKQSPEKAVKIE
ncbi:hypothetical protein GCM10023187_48200 [Nibrella viscosa]|uniref:Uncharacterized protein n=1 Tax=Nibrella viscosa TaxID=1084524 RepID=A0ABP8KTY8_9BACT